MDTGTGEQNRQRVPPPSPARGQTKELERVPQNGSARLMCAATRGGRRGDPSLISACLPRIDRRRRGKPQSGGGHPQRASRRWGRGGHPPKQQRTLLVHDLREREREGGTPPQT